MQPIVISEVTVSFDDFARFNKHLTGKRRLLVLVLTPLLAGYFFWTSLTADGGPAPTPGTLGLLALVMAGLVAAQLYGIRRAERRAYAGGKIFQTPTTYILSAEGLSVFSDAVRSDVRWPAVRRATVVGNWWYLQTSDAGYFLDAARVQPPATAADVTQLLQGLSLLK